MLLSSTGLMYSPVAPMMHPYHSGPSLSDNVGSVSSSTVAIPSWATENVFHGAESQPFNQNVDDAARTVHQEVLASVMAGVGSAEARSVQGEVPQRIIDRAEDKALQAVFACHSHPAKLSALYENGSHAARIAVADIAIAISELRQHGADEADCAAFEQRLCKLVVDDKLHDRSGFVAWDVKNSHVQVKKLVGDIDAKLKSLPSKPDIFESAIEREVLPAICRYIESRFGHQSLQTWELVKKSRGLISSAAAQAAARLVDASRNTDQHAATSSLRAKVNEWRVAQHWAELMRAADLPQPDKTMPPRVGEAPATSASATGPDQAGANGFMRPWEHAYGALNQTANPAVTVSPSISPVINFPEFPQWERPEGSVKAPVYLTQTGVQMRDQGVDAPLKEDLLLHIDGPTGRPQDISPWTEGVMSEAGRRDLRLRIPLPGLTPQDRLAAAGMQAQVVPNAGAPEQSESTKVSQDNDKVAAPRLLSSQERQGLLNRQNTVEKSPRLELIEELEEKSAIPLAPPLPSFFGAQQPSSAKGADNPDPAGSVAKNDAAGDLDQASPVDVKSAIKKLNGLNVNMKAPNIDQHYGSYLQKNDRISSSERPILSNSSRDSVARSSWGDDNLISSEGLTGFASPQSSFSSEDDVWNSPPNSPEPPHMPAKPVKSLLTPYQRLSTSVRNVQVGPAMISLKA